MTETRVSIENTPGGRWLVRITPPSAKFPMRSFDKLSLAKEYKYKVELHLTDSPVRQPADAGVILPADWRD